MNMYWTFISIYKFGPTIRWIFSMLNELEKKCWWRRLGERHGIFGPLDHNTLAGEAKAKPQDAKLLIFFTFSIGFAAGILQSYFKLIDIN